MATKKAPGTAVAAKKVTGTALATVDEQLAAEANSIKDAIAQPGGNKIKFEASGDIILPDGRNMGNRIDVVVLDFLSANKYYSRPYNPNDISPPDCFAIGRELNKMAPDETVPEPVNDKCATCELNQFGSAANGTGKACKNTRELAVLVLDDENPDAHNAPDAEIYTISLPPTALKSFDGYASYVARTMGGAPIKTIVSITAKNAGTYAAISFVDPVPNPDYAAHFQRRAECVDMLNRKPDYAAAEAAAATKKPAARRPGTTAGRRR